MLKDDSLKTYKNDVMYKIIYFNDEISLRPTDCLSPYDCTCKGKTVGIKCGYKPEEAHKFIINYYEDKVNYLKKITTKEFMNDMGIYQD